MTTEQLDTDADTFVDHVIATLPDVLQTHHMIRLMGVILTSYCDDFDEAGDVLLEFARLVEGYYAQDASGGECMCDNCTARRKADAH